MSLHLLTAEIGYALGREGKTSEAKQEIAVLREESKSTFVDPYFVALIYLGMGDEQATLQWLNRAYAVRSPFLISISYGAEVEADDRAARAAGVLGENDSAGSLASLGREIAPQSARW